MITQFEGAASDIECTALVRACDRRVTYRNHVKDPVALEAMDRLAKRCLDNARALYGSLDPEEGAVMLTRMGPGDFLQRHADNCRLDENGNWVPNHTPQRILSAAYYLNTDFEGGELIFDQHSLVIKPRQPGLLVIFPSDRHHVHEVKPILKGTFYNLLVFMVASRKHEAALQNSAV